MRSSIRNMSPRSFSLSMRDRWRKQKGRNNMGSSIRVFERQSPSLSDLSRGDVTSKRAFFSTGEQTNVGRGPALFVRRRNSRNTKPMKKRARIKQDCFARLEPILNCCCCWNDKFKETVYHSKLKHRSHSISKDQFTLRSGFLNNDYCNWRCGLKAGYFCSLERGLMHFFKWIFRKSFSVVLVFIFTSMFLLTVLFALFLYIEGRNDTTCFGFANIKDGTKTSMKFSEFYSLSWATFSTVGYGHVYPWHGDDNVIDSDCSIYEFICVLEAFVGLVYTSFCGAIFFAKALRSQSQAEVIFSEGICIRFNHDQDEADNSRDILENDERKKSTVPCPVLEFRIVNHLANQEFGGALVNASVKCIVTEDPLDVSSRTRNHASHKRLSHLSLKSNNAENNARKLSGNLEMNHAFNVYSSATEAFLRRRNNRLKQTQYENPSELEVEQPEYAYFQRIWWVRHKLDENSILLKDNVRETLRQYGGWRRHMMHHDIIRKSLRDFGHIVVTLSGISNCSAETVYAQKFYSQIDIIVGYQFVEVVGVEESEQGDIFVDFDLINDVNEQDGGGGEPLAVLSEGEENDEVVSKQRTPRNFTTTTGSRSPKANGIAAGCNTDSIGNRPQTSFSLDRMERISDISDDDNIHSVDLESQQPIALPPSS